MSQHSTPIRSQLPADPGKYDDPRNVIARRKGLAAPYIAGGEDPEMTATIAGERRVMRWLRIMIVVLVFGGFVLGIVAAVTGLPLLG